ncbi:GNAT family N-acetyltransferase [Paenarthrobacter sp. DKR-5]|uniref:GNAT family N-acetyltransferase n=1 Tax=Paenarthrobacter sp. DKR-5 TaxID=2835535 RepID=UPI001BDCB6E4|nr:GNAT family protein [Paenarthrobacter sp. DKR-5]MBT1002704.1 GNAT family N-acetyltransferase [Paenarthrobacter sp. DKR-5]
MSGAEGLSVIPVVPELDDGTVRLRALRPQDLPQLVAICRDEAAVRWTTVPPDYTEQDGQAYIREMVPEGWRTGERLVFAAADTATDTLQGTVGLHAFRAGTAEAGLNFGPAARGTGLPERAARLLLEYAFDQLNLQYLYWQALVPNWASRKLAWKLGFRFDAELRGFANDRGASADLWMLSLAAGDPRSPRMPWDGPSAGQS